MRPKPRNLQFHMKPGIQGPPPKPVSKYAKNLQKILGQMNTAITSLKGRGTDKTCVICCNGPSLSEAPLDQLAGVPNVEFVAINVPDPRVWPTQYWLLLDSITMYRPEVAQYIRDYQGLVVTDHKIKKNVQFRHLVRILLNRGEGISRDMLAGLRLGASGGFVALQFALYLGYKEIYFFGLDMGQSEDGETWSYGENSAVTPEQRVMKFGIDAHFWTKGVDKLTPEEQKSIFICSTINRWPFVEKLTRLSPAEGVERILGPKPEADSPDAADSNL